jgi:PAS domain S-box-containing protein
MGNDEMAINIFHEFPLTQLPQAIYLVSIDGKFLECSNLFKSILEIPDSNNILDDNIFNYYDNPREWDALLSKHLGIGLEKDKFINEIRIFRIGDHKAFIKDCSKALFHPETNEIIGLVGYINNITQDETYKILSERLAAAVFHVDSKDQIVFVNESMAYLFKYNSSEELLGKPISILFVDQSDADMIKEMVIKQSFVKNILKTMKKKDGDLIDTSITATINEIHGGYAGRVHDITIEQQYRRILNDMPMGTFMYIKRNGEEYLNQCNDKYSQMMGYASQYEIIGKPIKDLIEDFRKYDDYTKALELNGFLEKYYLSIKPRNADRFEAQVHVRLLKQGHLVIGRVGAIEDVTKERLLQNKIEALGINVGQVSHTFKHTISTILNKINTCTGALSPDPFGKSELPDAEHLVELLHPLTIALANSIDVMLDKVNAQKELSNRDRKLFVELSEKLLFLRNYKKRISTMELYAQTLDMAAQDIYSYCDINVKGTVQKEIVRQVMDNAWNIQRIASLISLHYIRDRVLEIFYEVSSLHDYITISKGLLEPRELREVPWLIKRAIMQIADYCQNRNIDIKKYGDQTKAKVYVSSRDIVRAISNILHNAIKYSWSRSEGNPWIGINIKTIDNTVLIEIEDFGVPIPAEEIESGKIFEFGFRGRLSNDRNRVGTGIGLADAKRVIKQHGGDIEIRSVPASTTVRFDDYTKPFITVVTIRLPISE